jgi:hypothetical protein
MANKGNTTSYLDNELVDKTHELGFTLSETLENHLKPLLTQFQQDYMQNNFNLAEKDSI